MEQEEKEVENIRSLLNHVDLLITKNNELLDATGARFNVFKLCGVNYFENKNSTIIAEL